MSCEFCTPEYTHIDGSTTCKNISSDKNFDALIAGYSDGSHRLCIAASGEDCTLIKRRIPISYCPFCGERL